MNLTPFDHPVRPTPFDRTYRFNDDGEPSSSAGKPILAAIDGQGFDHVVVVVTRWFGGIKLGIGGLIRAYGGTAERDIAIENVTWGHSRWRLSSPCRQARSLPLPTW